MDINERIGTLADELEEYLISARRKIHQYAEIGGEEVQTHQFICDELEELEIRHTTVADTGVLAVLETGKAGPKIALRADIDALPMTESVFNLKGKKACVSNNPNTCHACGHDAHTAMLLTSVRLLVQLKDVLCGTIYFCFEEGEECGKGWKGMLDALREVQPDTVWAIHVRSEFETGKINIDSGARMAGAAGVQIIVKGKGGHGSRPDKCINPTFAAACIVANAPGAFVNQLDAETTVTYGVTTIIGGGTPNIIPDTAAISGSLRFFSKEEGKKAIEILSTVAQSTAMMHRCSVELEGTKVLIGPVINDPACSKIAKDAVSEIMPEALCDCDKWYASESFGIYLSNFPGVMAFLGVGNEEKGTTAVHHNEHFDVDEAALIVGVKATVKYATRFMEVYGRKGE